MEIAFGFLLLYRVRPVKVGVFGSPKVKISRKIIANLHVAFARLNFLQLSILFKKEFL